MDETSVEVRRATVADANVLSAYMDALADEKLDTVSGQRFSPEEETDYLRRAQDCERAVFLIAMDGQKVVAVLDLWAGEKAYNNHAGALGMSVLASHRQRGLGRRMLRAAIEVAKSWPGFCRIELEVVPWNDTAIRLYESEGFFHEGRKRSAVNFRGTPEDLLVMGLVWEPNPRE